MQLQRIKDFLREKATQYNIPVKTLDASANLVRFTPPICTCVDCQPLVEIHVSNSLLHPAELYVLLQPAIAALDIPSVRDQAEQFLAVQCHHAKNILASAILDTSIHHCTNLKEMQ